VKVSDFFYKFSLTCLVVIIALAIALYFANDQSIFGLLKIVAIIGAVSLFLGVIASIWDN